ncbi:leucyl/phenylalanyl-tRNA--protein transferase [Aquimarina agarivorans]|uniref:leucyl/phenylalanyl-tRNA--protein transferase n=1 Tax=Aquimarina agarivorans TaxID=980584 RepID=UPI000248E644|nr:leucyl/phenylalanyl-tRNA--protein transferase [Aquimarina agarivorans]
MYLLDELIYFPPVIQADDHGLLAIGGDLSSERLLLAYKSGIFPWFEADQPILWYSPNPRMVLLFPNLKISKSMRQLLKKKPFTVTINQNFEAVITRCANQTRKNQTGTWITKTMINAYTKLHQLGIALSVEVWQETKLVGGLYGVNLKDQKIFCGESMFTEVSNASKVAFIYMCQYFQQKQYKFIDCQMHNDHLESLGAIEISRTDFMKALQSK